MKFADMSDRNWPKAIKVQKVYVEHFENSFKHVKLSWVVKNLLLIPSLTQDYILNENT